MRISTRLTLALAFTALLSVAALGIFVYIFTSRFHQKEFFERLEERVQLTELIFLEKNKVVEEAVRNRFVQRLDDELEFAVTLDKGGLDSLDRLFYQGLSEDILNNEKVRFWQKGRQGVGKRYVLPQGEFAVVVTAWDKFGQTKLHFLRQILLSGTLLCALLFMVVSWLSASRALQPLQNKIRNASHISASNLGMRLEVTNPDDEIGEMTIAFNRMLDRLQVSFEAQRNFVRNASHEIKNPLTAIIGEADWVLEKERTPEVYQETLKVIGSEAERLHTLALQLLELENAESLASLPEPEEIHLSLFLVEVLEKFPRQSVRLEIAPNENERTIMANRHLLETAIANIIDNALKYSNEQPITVQLFEKQGFAHILIKDHGIGIPAEDMHNLYQPFHRASNARGIRGHGIGLPLSNRIIGLHGGEIEVISEVDKGTEVLVKLPLVMAILS